MECHSKLDEQRMPFLRCISSFDGSYKKLKDTATNLFVSCFTSAFTSADIIFYNFLELCSALSEKIFLS